MALLSLVACAAVLRRHPAGRTLAVAAAGMLVYSSINTSGWLLQNQPATLAVTATTVAGALLVVGSLLRDKGVQP